jgi:hypothetical protein
MDSVDKKGQMDGRWTEVDRRQTEVDGHRTNDNERQMKANKS